MIRFRKQRQAILKMPATVYLNTNTILTYGNTKNSAM